MNSVDDFLYLHWNRKLDNIVKLLFDSIKIEFRRTMIFFYNTLDTFASNPMQGLIVFLRDQVSGCIKNRRLIASID